MKVLQKIAEEIAKAITVLKFCRLFLFGGMTERFGLVAIASTTVFYDLIHLPLWRRTKVAIKGRWPVTHAISAPDPLASYNNLMPIPYSLRRNLLTPDDDYVAYVTSSRTADLEVVIDRMVSQGSSITRAAPGSGFGLLSGLRAP